MTKTPTFDSSSSSPPHPIVALTGFMGSGKTSTGEALAELLGWEFVDLDGEIEAQEGPRSDFCFRSGARRHSARWSMRLCVSALRAGRGPTVLALGGGAFVQTNNVELLRTSARAYGVPGDAGRRYAATMRG